MGRVTSCMIPTLRMVMKSRCTLKRSGPSMGRFSRPIFAIGSGRSDAGTVRSFEAERAKSLASTCLERRVASRCASARVRGGSAARTVLPGASASSDATPSALIPARHHNRAPGNGRERARRCDCPEGKGANRFMTLTESDWTSGQSTSPRHATHTPNNAAADQRPWR